MDISNAIIAKSDQLNSADLTGGPETVAIVEVSAGDTEQPVKIVTDTFGSGRPFKPSKTVLRILANAWGKETAAWVGHRMTLYRDPSVRWAGEEVGGIRVSALSHIEKPISLNLPTSKGKHAKSTVTPLPESAPGRNWLAELKTADSPEKIAELGSEASAAGIGDDVLGKIRDAYKKAVKDNQ